MFIKGMLVGNSMKIVDMSRAIMLDAKPLEPDKTDGDWVIIASSAIYLAQGSKELIINLMRRIDAYADDGRGSICLETEADRFVLARKTTQEKPQCQQK